jgi:hypothetical protein
LQNYKEKRHTLSRHFTFAVRYLVYRFLAGHVINDVEVGPLYRWQFRVISPDIPHFLQTGGNAANRVIAGNHGLLQKH